MRVAVVGLGGVGSAAACWLARAGHNVTGYEQFAAGHDRGSSHGASRIIRRTYPDRLYTALMGEAYPLWDELETAVGEALFVRCGCLYFGPEGHPELSECADALAAENLPFSWLSADEVAERFPAMALRPGDVGVWQSDGGFLRADRCVAAHARLATAAGARLRYETPIAGIANHSGGEVLVQTATGETEAFDAAVITAGPWMGQWLPDCPLQVTRQQVVYVGIRDGEEAALAPEHCPTWIDARTHWYGFPSDGVIPGAKLALHVGGLPTDPDRVERTPDPDYVADAVAFATALFPRLSGAVTHTVTCLYTNTPDEDFILERLPTNPNVVLVSACSGHGFKFTTLMGKLAGEWATGESTRTFPRFAAHRFSH